MGNWLAFLSVSLLVGCGIHETKNSSSNQTIPAGSVLLNPTTQLSYAQISSSVFQVSCGSCHMNGVESGGVSLNTYAEVIGQLSTIESVVFNGSPVQMPPSGMPDGEMQVLQQWINQGTPDTVSTSSTTATPTPIPTATPVPSTLVPTYSSILTNVFTPKCLACHASGGEASNYPLDSYSAMMAKNGLVVKGSPSSSRVVTEIESGSMPPSNSGIPAVTAAELSVIETWITNGASD